MSKAFDLSLSKNSCAEDQENPHNSTKFIGKLLGFSLFSNLKLQTPSVISKLSFKHIALHIVNSVYLEELIICAAHVDSLNIDL